MTSGPADVTSSRIETIRDRLSFNAPALLLSLALFFQGAKNVLAFAYWALTALVLCGLTFSRPIRLGRAPAIAFVALALCLTLAYLRSFDRSVSAFWTFQWATLLVAGFALPYQFRETEPRGLVKTLWVLAAVSILVTARQFVVDPTGVKYAFYGLLPINYNFNAHWLAFLGVFLVFRALESEQGRARTLSLGLGTASLLLVVGGRSRGALLAIFIAFALGLRKRLPPKAVGIAVASVLALLFLLPHHWLFTRLRLHENAALRQDRVRIWSTALQSIRDYPLTGYGLGNFELGYQRHAFAVDEDPVRYAHSTSFAHNDTLQAAAEAGVPLTLLIWALLLYVGYRARRAPDSIRLSFLTLLIGSLFNSIFKMPLLAFTALLLLGWAAQYGEHRETDVPLEVQEPLRMTYRLLAFLGVLFSCWFALRGSWQMHDRWDKLVKLWRGDAAAWHAAGFTRTDPRQAATMQLQAVRLSPAQPYYREAFAMTLEATGDEKMLPLAFGNYQAALTLAPYRAINMLALGRLLYRRGDAKGAQTWFDRALALEPGYWEAYLWKARSLFQQKRRSDAITLLNSLAAQRDTYMQTHPIGPRALAPYERVILNFDADVVRTEMARFRRHE